MFQIATLVDSVRVAPKNFGKEFQLAITDELNSKYSNKIVANLGLCVCVFDLVEIEDPIIHPNEGGAFIRVKFRLILFRPFVGEILVGKVKSSDAEGIKVTLGFFDEIFIPASLLQQPCSFDRSERVWIWNYEGNSLFLDVNETIRVRVLSELFLDVPPVEKDLLVVVNSTPQPDDAIKSYARKISCYTITVSKFFYSVGNNCRRWSWNAQLVVLILSGAQILCNKLLQGRVFLVDHKVKRCKQALFCFVNSAGRDVACDRIICIAPILVIDKFGSGNYATA